MLVDEWQGAVLEWVIALAAEDEMVLAILEHCLCCCKPAIVRVCSDQVPTPYVDDVSQIND